MELKLSLPAQDAEIKLYEDSTFTLNSMDNLRSYDLIYVAPETDHFSTKIGLTSSERSVIILAGGGASGIHPNCATLCRGRLFVCVGDSLFALSIPYLELLWIVQADSATCFGVYSIDDGVLIHGELEISRVDDHGKILWQKSGSDIFVTPEGEAAFQIVTNEVYALSWDGRRYKFDLDGNDLQI